MSRFFVSVLLLTLAASALWATDLPASFGADTVLTPAGNPYNLVSDVSIPAGVTVTLAAGVTVIVSGDYRLYLNGTLAGNGTPATRITFRAPDAAARGAWEGIYVGPSGRLDLAYATISNAVTNVTSPGGALLLDHCLLKLASEDGLLVWNDANAQLTNSAFSQNGRRGVTFEGYQVRGQISGCQFRSNGGYPLRLKATLVELLKTGNTYWANGTQRLSVSASLTDDISDDDAWTKQSIPFEVGAEESGQTLTVTAQGRLVVPAGTAVQSDGIVCRGKLEVNGTTSSPCTLGPRLNAGDPGAWPGLQLGPGSAAVITDATLRNATTALTADDATVNLTDSTLGGCLYDGARLTGATALTLQRDTFGGNGRNGLRLEGAALSGQVSNCTFRYNHSYPVWATARDVRLLGAGNVYQSNTVPRLGVSCGGTPDLSSGSHTWTPQGLPLDLTVSVAGTTLNIGSGATLNLPGAQTLYLGGMIVKGMLNISGAPGQIVRFRPPPGQTTRGSWNGLQFTGGGGQLTAASVELAKTGVSLTNASPSISGCWLQRNQLDGLSCANGAAPVVTGTCFTANGRHGVYLTGTAAPSLGDLSTASATDDGGNSLSGNGGYDLYNGTTHTIRAQNNTWVSSDPAVVATRIYDANDEPGRGLVIFSPVRPAAAPAGPLLAGLSAAAGRGGTVTVRWRQSGPGVVTASVMTIAGHCVARPCLGRAVAAGLSELSWSPLNSLGQRLPPGTYLLAVEARAANGQSGRSVTLLDLR